MKVHRNEISRWAIAGLSSNRIEPNQDSLTKSRHAVSVNGSLQDNGGKR
jgi:hypothetical protein